MYYLLTYCMKHQPDGDTKETGAGRLHFPMLTPKCQQLFTASCQHPTSVSSSGGTRDDNTGLITLSGTVDLTWFSSHAITNMFYHGIFSTPQNLTPVLHQIVY